MLLVENVCQKCRLLWWWWKQRLQTFTKVLLHFAWHRHSPKCTNKTSAKIVLWYLRTLNTEWKWVKDSWEHFVSIEMVNKCNKDLLSSVVKCWKTLVFIRIIVDKRKMEYGPRNCCGTKNERTFKEQCDGGTATVTVATRLTHFISLYSSENVHCAGRRRDRRQNW